VRGSHPRKGKRRRKNREEDREQRRGRPAWSQVIKSIGLGREGETFRERGDCFERT
jgi:hypothetical protein